MILERQVQVTEPMSQSEPADHIMMVEAATQADPGWAAALWWHTASLNGSPI